jgi:hypothetical protein
LKKLGHWDMLFNDIFLPTLLPLCHEWAAFLYHTPATITFSFASDSKQSS